MTSYGRRWIARTVAIGLVAACTVAGGVKAQAADTLVFAAASMKNALDELSTQWSQETGKKATVSYAASSALARQIESGAPADIFISADLDWMDYVEGKNLIQPDSRVTLLGNRIVLVAPSAYEGEVEIGPDFPLAELLGDGRLAIGGVDSVPAGKYGKAALESLGVWTSVQDKLAQGENVRAALALVSRGEAPFGIVYQTDAAADPGVRVVGTFPEDSHPPILYPAALLAESSNSDAASFLDYLKSPEAVPAFERQGFTVLK
ncbi:molybdate ABC transporter substrate-binding protein [Marinivivus vitaminiproducens]|uniref:molybdate ABC transporter substrate-binding protein n=1 Tax=Marinivivus vitaminiproducens TaxID=3035935 RepID=UPI00279F9085|nr:molybdate ABC transporter substrate-binding protein [Geminicoccaceae bacterium SCSIO 64248]